MTNKILKTLGALVLWAGLGFNLYGQETIPSNLHLRDINGNYLGDMRIELIMPLLMKFPSKPNGGIEFDYDNQNRLIEEKGYFYNNSNWDTLQKIITVKYEYINGERKINKIIYDNNANEKMDEGDEIRKSLSPLL